MSESAAAAATPAPAQPLDYSAATDADLLAGMARVGDSVARAHAAFAEFHRRHAAYLFAVCARRYRAAAEDVVAETLRRVYESAALFDRAALSGALPPDDARRVVRAWVGRLVRWVAADHFARRDRRPPVTLACIGSVSDPRAAEPSKPAGRDAELVAEVRGVIESLPEREQDIAWTVAHGWSPEHGQARWSQDDLDAIAERFGLSRDNIRQVRARLIKKLRSRLEPLLSARPADR